MTNKKDLKFKWYAGFSFGVVAGFAVGSIFTACLYMTLVVYSC